MKKNILQQTASQTVGPFFAFGLTPEQSGYDFPNVIGRNLRKDGVEGIPISLVGQVLDGDNKPINDATLLTNIDLYFSSTKIHTQLIIPIKSGTKTYNINCTDLQYIESEHVYTNFYFTNHRQSIRISLTKFLEQLPNKEFIQISRSTAINPTAINHIGKSSLKLNDKTFKISEKYKSNLSF